MRELDTRTVPSRSNSTPGRPAQEGGVALLAESEDHGVRREGLETAGRLGEAGVVELHRLDLELGALERLDRPQPVDAHPLVLGVLRLLLVGGHLLASPPVDDQRLLRPHPPRRARGIHRRVAAAVDGDAPSDHGLLAARHAVQERHRVQDRPGVRCRDVDPLRQVGADRHEHRVEGALATLRLEVLDPMAAREAHPERRDPIDLGPHHVPRQPVGRDPVAHHPARLRTRVANLDLMAEPRQMVGRGEPARPRTDHQDALAAALRRGCERPPLLKRQIAQEALDGMDRDRAVELGAVAHALARVVADSPVDRRERVVGRQHAPRQLVLGGLDVRHPALDVLAGRAAGIARRQQIDVHRPRLTHRPGSGAPMLQIRYGRDVRSRAGRSRRGPALRSLKRSRLTSHDVQSLSRYRGAAIAACAAATRAIGSRNGEQLT